MKKKVVTMHCGNHLFLLKLKIENGEWKMES